MGVARPPCNARTREARPLPSRRSLAESCWAVQRSMIGDVDLTLYLPDLSGGGAERMMVNLARGIAERGVSVHIVLVRRSGPYLREVPDSVRVVDLAGRGVLASVPSLVDYLRRHRPKALLATLDHASVAAIVAKKLAGVATKVFVREANVIAGMRRGGIRQSLLPLAMRVTYRHANGIIAVSNGVAESVVRHTGTKTASVHTIYNPVVSSDMIMLSQESLDHPWFSPDAPPAVVAAGRLVEQKDFSTLVRAFSMLREQRAAKLVILGEGDERAALLALGRELGVSADMELPGFVDNPFKYMARASLFVLSSRWEGLPSVLVQAMACGCPVVSTDCAGDGPREILQGGAHGALVPVGEPRALADAMSSTIDGPVDESELRARAADFTVDRAVDRYLELMLPTKARLFRSA